jgi:probable F420-dependent oxidoreductase
MTHPRKFRFGVQVTGAPDGKAWADLARRVESLGFSTLFMPDHFGDQLAPIPALAAAAAATTSLRVGALVLDNDYKHPVVQAKELATLDVLSGGRLEVGLGAGWLQTDYDQSGIPYDRPGRRIDRFEEALTVIKDLFGEGEVSFEGEHYTITGLDGLPKPVQKPRPPFIIGAGGPRMLGIAAREADIVGVNPSLTSGRVDRSTSNDGTAEAYDRKLATLKEAAGDRYDDLELNSLMFLVAETDDRLGFATNIAPAFGMEPDVVLDSPLTLIGTVDEMCETLETRRRRWGLSYFVCQTTALEALIPVVERLTGT